MNQQNNLAGNAAPTVEEVPGGGASVDAARASMGLAAALNLSSKIQGKTLDRLRLHEAISKYLARAEVTHEDNWIQHLKLVATDAGVEKVSFFESPDPARLPAISWLPHLGWVTVRAQSPTGDWLLDCQGKTEVHPAGSALQVASLKLREKSNDPSEFQVKSLFKSAFLEHKKIFIEGAIAGVVINLLALGSSLYSMQVYDRVIPTQGYATLVVLSAGVLIAMLFEFILKLVRTHLIEHAVVDLDAYLSRAIFGRLLHIRLDQLPTSVGSLSSQIRGHETIRAFLSSTTFYALVDVPFGLAFIVLIGMLGGVYMTIVPLVFLIVSIAVGTVMRDKIDFHAKQSTAAANMKTGLLVEVIEGAETIKAGGGGWHALSRWIHVVEESMKHEGASRTINEKTSHLAALMQAASYAALVATGAYFTAEGSLTMGALIACSILSGRAMAPMTQLPGLMTQRALANAALDGLEKVYALETDNHNVDRPLVPERIHGKYVLERVRFAYPSMPQALSVTQLSIQPGEKVGVIGPIGAGKSTLLRLLTGMYHANEGRISLDGLDIQQISQPILAEKIGYLQQDHRLFSGTLRQNLLIGLPDPGDEVIKSAAAKTSLISVITNHPKGLEMQISEGGKGLSGGQRQLVALTRLLLSQPDVWLLDEPTASMDEQTEQRCLQVLQMAVRPTSTMVVVTHKPTLLGLVDRLIVVSNHQVVMDGPRDQVIAKLNENAMRQQAAQAQGAAASAPPSALPNA